MFKDVYYDTFRSEIHLWDDKDGHVKERWSPYVFEKDENGDVKSIYGNTVVKKEFKTYKQYKSYQEENEVLEDRIKPEIQFLAEKYHTIPDDEIKPPRLKIRSMDIEIEVGEGFPDVLNPKDKITAITLMDNTDYKSVTFGLKDYTGNGVGESFIYMKCESEEVLLKRFFAYMRKFPCDVLTGWNILGFISSNRTQGFDLPYIINRTKILFGDDTEVHYKLSPIGIVRTWLRDGIVNIDIAGISIIDYMDIYKWYSPNNLESYSLDFVCKFELEKGKVDYSEYESLNELYEQDFNKFIEYNIVDTKRVLQLEKKLGYIKLIQSLSLLTKVPMKYYHATTQLMEGIMLTYFRRNNMCAPRFTGGKQEAFEAAYVKEPQKGQHNWICDLDIASSYPTAIITLNMSNETYWGRIIDLNESTVVSYVRKRMFEVFTLHRHGRSILVEKDKLDVFNKSLQNGLFSVSPCGAIFTTKHMGIIADIQRRIFEKRQSVKRDMKAKKQQLVEREDFDIQEEIDRLFSFQWALKILLNAMFGLLSTPYSRYFNLNIAKAITSCGRHTVKSGERLANEIMNNTNDRMSSILVELGSSKKPEVTLDFIAAMDTDSLFLMVEYFVKSYGCVKWDGLSKEEKIVYTKRISEVIENYVNERVFTDVQKGDYNSQVDDFKIYFEQEIIAQSALFVAKKKYGYWCVDEAGIPKDELRVTGLEIVRSDSPEQIRDMLKSVLSDILKNEDEEKLRKKIQQYKKELMKCLPEEIAANIGVNGISKYIEDGNPIKGTPWHVKAVANYKKLLKKLSNGSHYDDIHEGSKIKVVYLKPNRYGMETMAFLRWPKEFDKFVEVDKNKMIRNFFEKKIEILLQPMGKCDMLKNSDVIFDIFG